MSETNQILAKDLEILETMVAGMSAYLASDATHWPMDQEGMPKLTIGGCLMRQDRLQRLRNEFDLADQTRLNKAIDSFNGLTSGQIVRFEKRAHDELHARLREWTSYLRDATSKTTTDREYFAGVVDTRIVITALMKKLSQPPYSLNAHLAEDVAQMDRRLRGQWQSGEFLLEPVWARAYPPDVYWWLYGYPK